MKPNSLPTLPSILRRLAFSILSTIIIFTSAALAQQTIKVYPTSIRLEKGKTRTYTAIAFDAAGNFMPNQTFTFSRSGEAPHRLRSGAASRATRNRIILIIREIWPR